MLKKFICCHKDIPQNYLLNDDITLVSNRQVINQSQHKIIFTDGSKDDRLWSELSTFETIYKNTKSDDWIQTNHYRRLLNHVDDKICLPVPYNQPASNIIMYSKYHNADDLLVAGDVIKEKYPEIYPEYIEMINSQIIYPYNIVCFPRKLFKKWYTFLYDVLEETLKRLNITDYESAVNRINSKYYLYLKDFSPNNSVEYQARIVSFLSERISTAFYMHIPKMDEYCNTKIYAAQVKFLEEGQKI